jgi:hypothetical protein
MQEPGDSILDPLDAALGGIGQRPADDNLRAAVLARTIGAIRRRRRLKRCALAAGLLGCYLAGITTVGILRPGATAGTQAANEAVTTAQPQPQKVPPSPSPRRTGPDTSQLVAANPSGYESWRHIGDHYLQETGDISLAVAGYSQAIDLASDEERAISPEHDNWLLMALKDARAKEKNHAHVEQKN